jgi:hypothetical protein
MLQMCDNFFDNSKRLCKKLHKKYKAIETLATIQYLLIFFFINIKFITYENLLFINLDVNIDL